MPQEFDDHPVMAEALSLEQHADQVFDYIIETPAATLAGIVAKLELGKRGAGVTQAAMADLRRWMSARS